MSLPVEGACSKCPDYSRPDPESRKCIDDKPCEEGSDDKLTIDGKCKKKVEGKAGFVLLGAAGVIAGAAGGIFLAKTAMGAASAASSAPP